MKNRQIQFWRIVFTYIIAFYHLKNAYKNYASWYIAVEFFFMVSGYLLANKIATLKALGGLQEVPAWKYTWSKYKKYMPHCIYSFFVAFVINGVYQGWNFGGWISELVKHIPEILLVHMGGLNLGNDYPYNSPTWYLSVLLLVGYFTWYFMSKTEKIYVDLICPLSILLIYPYLYRTYGFIGEHWGTDNFILNAALLRGVADINLGILSYKIVKNVCIHNKRRAELVSDICFILGGVVIPTMFYKSTYDFLFLFLIYIGVTTGFIAQEAKTLPFESKLIEKWAAITPAIYLNHKVFRSVFYKLWPTLDWKIYILWFVFITIYSVFTYWLVSKLVELIKEKLR